MTTQSYTSTQEDNCDDDINFWEDRQLQPHPLNVSRLSVCSGSSIYGGFEDDNYGDGNCSYQAIEQDLSRLYIESFDGDLDEEFSDQEKQPKGLPSELLFSDSDEETGFNSLPATPPRRRRTQTDNHSVFQNLEKTKEYASDNEVHNGVKMNSEYLRNKRRRRRKVIEMGRLLSTEGDKRETEIDQIGSGLSKCYSFSGESEGAGSTTSTCGAGLVVITRPKGGTRSLCMDLDEVKACRDLGFELEHERMLEMPSASRLSLSAASNFDTASSGSNSPIANWRISSPGDDPRDVKARLKVWAQAVALASTSRQGS